MEEYINREKLLANIRRVASRTSLGGISEPYLNWKEVVGFILEAPADEVGPVRHGKWIPVSTKPGVYAGMKCSECKARISYSDYNHGQHLYCHKCGAKMCEE